ncbi:TonB-dependent receptor [Massilibacteroides sp.]|uniref:TonB-dependent receptor n=1 Tax=Massilibacteroides sp. TaxID=2034766 RepID=UPI00261A8509|nr:TonB-dependent receptor [Massilibacteroides sp.]MDD4514339.1 TonB-dependent receptor [Massilibacteroides sp.]
MTKKNTNKRLRIITFLNLLKISAIRGLFIAVIFLLTTGICSATTAYAQTALVSLHIENKPMQQVLQEIEKNSDFKFFYNNKQINLSREVSISASEKDVFVILDQIFNNTDIAYKVLDKNIVLAKKNMLDKTDLRTLQQQQNKTITGTIVDGANEPVIGANVVVKGMTQGTITDVDGNFSLQDVPENAVLVITYIGYIEQQINTTGKNQLSIILKEDTQKLEEVVVVGYGTQKKVNLTGAVDQVTSEVFDNRSVSNVSQALQGTIPNLNISLADGKPTRSADYNVRGTTSIGQGGSALVLIDGVEGDPALLNPNDIASVSVLKDAASAAIYGARGSFGVVLITTKNPEKGKVTINYSGSVSLQKPTAVPDIVSDGLVYAEHFREAYYGWNNYSSLPSKINKSQLYSDAWLEKFKERRAQGITDEVEVGADGTYTYYGNVNYYDELYKNQTYAQDHNMTVSGGTEKADFYISGRYYGYDGLFRYNTDNYDMLNIRAKGSLQLTDWLRLTNNMEFSDMTYHNPINVGEGGSIWRNIADEGHPTSPIFNPDGSLTMSAAYTVGDFIYGKNGLDTHKKVLKNTTGFSAKFLNNKLRINGDFTFRNYDNNDIQRRVPVPYSTKEGVITKLSEKYNDYKKSIRNTLYTATNLYAEYEDTFNDAHYLKGMVGYNYETSKYESTYVQRNGLLLSDSESLNLALGDAITTSAGWEKWRIAGAFFRLNYGFKDRYLLEVNGRYDGSSKFPESQQWAFFPSVSLGWRISEESFWNVNENFISDAKLRGSYGSLGNGNVDSYSFLELLSISTAGYIVNGAKNKYTNSPAVIPRSLTWETATTTDVGADIGFLGGKLRLTGDYYVRKTTDMYTKGVTLPDVFGATSPKGNYADMTTKGWELSINYRDRFTLVDKPFNYEIKATIADYKSTIDRYNNSTKSLDDYYEGQRVGEIWGYRTDGLFQSEEEINGYINTIIKTSSNGTTYRGDIKFVDVNKNGKIDYGDNTVDNPGDKVILGNEEPRYIYSFTLSGDWNSFFFSAFFQGVGKQDWYPSNESGFWGQYNRPYNQLPTWHLGNYWTEDNPNAYLPRYAGYTPSLRTTITDRYIQNIAYIRLRNIQVGYTLPQSLTSKAGMQNVRVYLSGENLWSWSPLYKRTKDYDVTNTSSGSDPDLTSGTSGDNYTYPLMKNITFGLSVTF